MTPRGYKPASYPHLTNGGEKPDERPEARVCKESQPFQRVRHPGGPSWEPATSVRDRCPPSWSQATRNTARPRRPASEAQSARSPGARVLPAPTHAPATSAQRAGTTDPSLRIRPSRNPRSSPPAWLSAGSLQYSVILALRIT